MYVVAMTKDRWWAARCVILTMAMMASMGAVMARAQSAGERRASGTAAEIYLVGSVHDMHFDERYHYSLVDLEEQVRSLAPEVICGEITPKALDRAMEGNFPPEAAMLAVMAPQWQARFVAADWRVSFKAQRRGELQEAKDKPRAAAVEAEQKRMRDYYENFAGESLYDLTSGSAEFLARVDHLFEEVVGADTTSDLAAGAWHERNRRIVGNCVAASGGARRIVFVFGAAHLPQLRRQLEARGLKAQIPARAFRPAGMGKMPPAVVARWKRNLRSLEGIEKGNVAVSADARAKVRDTNRAPQLRREIALYEGR